MKCNNCGREIDDNLNYCKYCKSDKKLKNEITELENAIVEQKKLNELEITKELKTIDDIPLEKDLEQEIEEPKEEHITREELNKDKIDDIKEKKSHKKLIIIISIVIVLLIIGIIIFFILTKQKPKEEIKEKIDYETVIKDYGDSVKLALTDFMKDSEEVPTWQEISELIKYNKYEVSCDTHYLYKSGNVYLTSCKVNNKKVEFSYGKEEEEKIELGKEIKIYKTEYDSYINDATNGTLVGTINCKTDSCSFVSAYEKYVLIKEDGYYLYNYETNSIELGPFDMGEYDYNINILSNGNKVYGVFYTKDNINYIYNVNTGKTLNNIKGTPENFYMFTSASLANYGYIIMNNNNVYDFVNLKTGNISYTITEKNLNLIIEDKKNNIAYITSSNDNADSVKVYNSNGKEMFDGKYVKLFKVRDNGTIVVSENGKTYKVYDSNLKLKLTSKSYDKIMMLGSDFEVVLNGNYLTLIDEKDNELTRFIEWDSNNYSLHTMLSGWYTENEKNGIYLVVENKNIPFGTLGSGVEYFYIPSTKESGSIETTGVGGYAKPVLYLYPEKTTNVTVTFSKPELLTTTYPKFNTSWKVTAHNNGDLYDLKGKYYYGLYWEESGSTDIDFSEGFYVTKENAIEFLEEKLTTIGLNPKERNEFIMYWLPILEKNGKNLVYFELTKERDVYNKLIINPSPDSILRIAIHVKKVNKKTSIKEEKLTTFNRTGFTAVEWGGVIH